MAHPPCRFLAAVQEEGLVGWQVRKWSRFGHSSLRWGWAGPADANVVRWDVRSPSISRIDAGECQYDEIAYRMSAQYGEKGTGFLLEELERVRDEGRRLRAVLGGLRLLPAHHPLGTQICLFYLGHTNEFIVMGVIDGLAHLEATEAHDRVLAHLSHPSQYVVGGVPRYMSKLFRDEALPILLEALRDERYIVRK